jgi:TonB family protein
MSTQTIDTTDLNSSPTRRPGESPRQQSVCIEIPISVHGSRSATGNLNNTEAAKPFLEETRTMIVFPQGAVLRLTEPVSEGQILILKNARVKQEVACRVVSSKTNASAKGYVEVEFFQAAAGFWGITFPAASSSAPTESAPVMPAPRQTRPEPSAVKPAFFQPPVAAPKPVAPVAPAAPVISKPAPMPVAPAAVIPAPPVSIPEPVAAPPTPTPVSEVPAAPTVSARVAPPLTPESTQELNRAIAAAWATPVEPVKPAKKAEPIQEVQPIKEAVVVPAAPSPSITDSVPAAASKSVNPTKPKFTPPAKASRETLSAPEPLAMADSIGYPSVQAPVQPSSVSSIKLARTSTSSSIETRKVELTPSQIASEAVLGRPMFSNGAEVPTDRKSGSSKTWMIAVAAVLVIGAGAGTYWWMTNHKLGAKPESVSAAAPAITAPAGTTQPGTTPAGSNSQPAANPASAQNSVGSQKSNAVPGTSVPNALALKTDKNPAVVTARRPSVLPAEKIAAPVSHSTNSSIAATPAPDVTTKAANAPIGSLSSILPGMGQPSSVPAPPPSRPAGPPPVSSVLQQPKLLQTSAPVYPRIAATRGDWGDVVIDAVVGENGRVTDTKVISGPDTLRQSALQVVRSQTYQPAKLNGKPVSMHVTVKVPFPKPR